jgi:uncharacterized repeat protein (TIGR03803 family)
MGKTAKLNKGRFAVLYSFAENSTDPLYPSGIIAQGRDGGLYSSTNVGGLYNLGTVFAITTAGQLSVPYNFTDPLDEYGGPGWGLTLSTDGTFYGACTYCGGGNGYGTVFKVTPSGDLTTLYDFTGQNEDAYPHAPPIQAADGWFYGTAAGDFYGHGSEVYRMTPSGDKVTLFHLNHRQGAAPGDPVVQGTDGNFYATTNGGGNNGNCGNSGCGVIFKITSKGHVAVLHDFESDEDDGFNPVAPLIQASDGYFYGTVPYGGVNYDYGTVFRISPSGKFKLLHIFNGYSDGRFPSAALVQATDGNFYGTTRQGGGAKSGVIFKITPQGRFSVIYNFDGTTSAYPLSALVQHTNGKLYGETTGYQINGGTFYSLDLGLGPFVGLLSSLGRAGQSIGILGQGFTGTKSVSFNGTPAQFDVVSDTYLTATVPQGATTGFVTVATPGGKLKSSKRFHFQQ